MGGVSGRYYIIFSKKRYICGMRNATPLWHEPVGVLMSRGYWRNTFQETISEIIKLLA